MALSKIRTVLILLLSLLLIGFAGVRLATAAENFRLSDIPSIHNQEPLTLAAEEGFWTDYLRDVMLPQFTRHTGVPVEVVAMPLGDMYLKQQTALERGEGRYDLLAIEAGWAKEWAANGYTVPLLDLAAEFDPQGRAAMARFLEPYYESLLNILSYRGQYHSIPYNNYIMGNHYRADLFEHPQEQAAFHQRYGYDLAPPQNVEQLLDVAEFFTREAGATLGGKTLTHHFYGLALMAGHKPHINDEFSALLWGQGGAWFRPQYTDDGTLRGFKVEANSQLAVQAARTYLKLLEYAHPTDPNWAFLESANALADGRVAMWPFAYNNVWPVSAQVEQRVPGARIGIAGVPLARPYNGAYATAVAYDSHNPEAAYWLLKYIGSYEGQLAYALGGGNPCRRDVVLDPRFQQEDHRLRSAAFLQSHRDNEAWSGEVLKLGHFSSIAMGRIYPELMHTSYRIATRQVPIDQGLEQLTNKIKQLQNRYGELPTLD